MKIRQFITIAKRNYIGNELYVFGIIHGLQFALCDEDLDNIIDCEVFNNKVVYRTITTQEKYHIFENTVKRLYPGLCEFNVCN